MAHSDEELLGAIRGGCEEAFELLFERYLGPVSRHLARLVRDEHAASDLTQEVFLRVWTRAGQWDGRGSGKAWIFRIATNLGLNHLRAVRRRRERPLEPPPDASEGEALLPGWLVESAAHGPEAVLELAEQRRRLRGLIEELPEEKREVLRMVEAEMELKEVAERLGIPEGTVKSRLHSARKRLVLCWNDRDED